jgi:hypothetical protein
MLVLNNRSRTASVTLLCSLLLPSAAWSQVTLFPRVESFEYPIGAPLPSGIVGRLLTVRRGESRYGAEREAEAAVGESIPVIGLAGGAVPVHLDLGLRVTGRFSMDDPRSALISNDWFVAIQSVAQWPTVRLALELSHESSHLGDEYAERFAVPRVDWTREVSALWVRLGGGPFRAHAMASYALIDELSLPRAAAGLGFDYRGKAGQALGATLMPVVGLYAESVGFADWKVTTSARAGLELGSGNRRIGMSLVYLNGLSTQRQFFRQSSRYFGFELRFDF